MPRESKSEQRARRIGKLQFGAGRKHAVAVWWITGPLRYGMLIAQGPTRAEATRKLLAMADRLARKIERSR